MEQMSEIGRNDPEFQVLVFFLIFFFSNFFDLSFPMTNQMRIETSTDHPSLW